MFVSEFMPQCANDEAGDAESQGGRESPARPPGHLQRALRAGGTHAWGGQLHGQSSPPLPSSTPLQAHRDIRVMLATGVTFLLLAGSCTSSEESASCLSPARRCPSIPEKHPSPPRLLGAMGVVAPACGTHSSWWWQLVPLHLDLFGSVCPPQRQWVLKAPFSCPSLNHLQSTWSLPVGVHL